MTVRAILEDTVIAESDDTVMIEGNHYFPPEAVSWRHLTESGGATVCPWKGIASYYTVTVDGVSHPDAAWTYRHPIPWVRRIKNRVGRSRGGGGLMAEQVDVVVLGLGVGGEEVAGTLAEAGLAVHLRGDRRPPARRTSTPSDPGDG